MRNCEKISSENSFTFKKYFYLREAITKFIDYENKLLNENVMLSFISSDI
jgi:hypothetical protein